jgi:signal transduction histidine kinase
LLILLILGLQYVGGRYAVELARSSMEADLESHLDDLGRVAQTTLYDAALGMTDRLLDAEWAAMAATSATQAVEPSLAVYMSGLDSYLTEPMDWFAADARLEKLVLLGPEGRVLYDTSGASRLLRPFAFWPIDQPEIQQALLGTASASPAYTVAQDAFKRHYVPILDATGQTAAVACLVAGRDYLGQIEVLARAIRRLNLVLTLLMAGVGWMVYGLLRRQRRMEQEAAQADRLAAMGRLAAGFAHEMRNPLGIVRAFTEDLERDLAAGDTSERAREACREIVEEVDRMNGLVGQFLNYSRAGRERAETEAAPAMEGLRSVLTILAPTAEQSDVRLEGPAEPSAEGVRVALASAPLKQVLMNLLMNAIQASPRGGRVWTEIRTSGRSVELRVMDEGAGVAATEQGKIFEPFYTTRAGGSGLGLAVSREIALGAGGSLEVGAPPNGKGACFVLSLPKA